LSNGVSLELAVPRTRNQNFYPLILALIKDQNEELAQISTELYSSGLTTEQIGGILEKIYVRHPTHFKNIKEIKRKPLDEV
jgi:transposase-like protein